VSGKTRASSPGRSLSVEELDEIVGDRSEQFGCPVALRLGQGNLVIRERLPDEKPLPALSVIVEDVPPVKS
jgi:hypothetical protein